MKLSNLQSDHKGERLVGAFSEPQSAVETSEIATTLLAAVEIGAASFPRQAAAPLLRAPRWCGSSGNLRVENVDASLHVEIKGPWRHAHAGRDLHTAHTGQWFREPNGNEMFLRSGSVSSAGEHKGSAYTAKRRARHSIDSVTHTTNFMKFGDRMRMQARGQGAVVLDVNDQRVVSVNIPPTRS